MDSDAGGWLWFVIDVVMVAAFAVALIYATVLWRRRRGRLEQVSELATARSSTSAKPNENGKPKPSARPRERTRASGRHCGRSPTVRAGPIKKSSRADDPAPKKTLPLRLEIFWVIETAAALRRLVPPKTWTASTDGVAAPRPR
jgi:hypothetical protein